MSSSLACLLAACCWPSNDKDVTDTIKQCMADDDQTAHSAMRTLAAQAEDDETWGIIVMKVARKFGNKQWRMEDGQRTDAATQLLLLMDLMPLCDSRRAINTSEDLLSFARDEANPAQLRNSLVIWNAFAGKFDLRVVSRMLTDELLTFFMDNANHKYTTDGEVCMHAILTLERFAKTGTENARRIGERFDLVKKGYYERLEELLHYSPDHQLRLICEWLLTHNQVRVESGVAKKRKRGNEPNTVAERMHTPGRGKKSKNIVNKQKGHSKGASAASHEQDDYSDDSLTFDSSTFDEPYNDDSSFSMDEYHGVDLESRTPWKEVKLSHLDRTNFVKLSSSGYEVRNDSTSFGSIRANCYVSSIDSNGSPCRLGKWYYEVTLRTGGIIQIGWATKDCVFKPEEGSGVGDDFSSYAYDGCRRQIWHAASSFPCGREERRWRAGDVVGCLFDAEAGTISFSLNGKFCKGFKSAFSNVRAALAFYPALSIGAFQQCRVNFGSKPFKFKPAAYRSVDDYANIYNISLESEGNSSNDEDSSMPALLSDAQDSEDHVSSIEDLDDERLCKICYAQEAEIKLRPCGHREICFACSIRLVVCPVCRCPIEDREHTGATSSVDDSEESREHLLTSTLISCASLSTSSEASSSQRVMVVQ